MQKYVDELRQDKKCDIVVLLSHDGFNVDQEVARVVKGIDIILSGHTHDPSPKPIKIDNTLIVIAGSHGKYVGRLDLDVQKGKLKSYSYKLIPIASDLIPADKEMENFVNRVYKPFDKELNTKLVKTDTLLYKRDTFYSTFDRLIGDAIQNSMDSDIVFTPGYRWGTTVLPNEYITVDNVYEMTAITYPNVYTFELTGKQIRQLLEDIADNVFNPNPLYQQGGDMSRLLGITYSIKISGQAGNRISNLLVKGKKIEDNRVYRVSAWGGNLQKVGKNLQENKIASVYDITIDYLKKQTRIRVPEESNVKILDFKNGYPI
jgi:sulfur-oxidizing protein SoxB